MSHKKQAFLLLHKSQDDKTGTETGWFVGVTINKAPNNLLAVMMVEDVKDRGGSHYVVPKVKTAFVEKKNNITTKL